MSYKTFRHSSLISFPQELLLWSFDDIILRVYVINYDTAYDPSESASELSHTFCLELRHKL